MQENRVSGACVWTDGINWLPYGPVTRANTKKRSPWQTLYIHSICYPLWCLEKEKMITTKASRPAKTRRSVQKKNGQCIWRPQRSTWKGKCWTTKKKKKSEIQKKKPYGLLDVPLYQGMSSSSFFPGMCQSLSYVINTSRRHSYKVRATGTTSRLLFSIQSKTQFKA